MQQLTLFNNPPWTVANLTRYLKNIFEADPALRDLWVEGEISNLSKPSSGHIYFTIKDSTSALACVMFRSAATQLSIALKDGEAIEAHGNISIYETAGRYQLYVDTIRPVGQGRLFQEFIRLKNSLEAEGLFDSGRKRPIPAWPKRIGVITSPSGAAFQDIIKTLNRRFPLVEVILAPTQVQGMEAPAEIVAAFQKMNRLVQPEVIILARGGGSIEDLWAFNDERVARAVASSSSPVISGVGHETDFTIVDFVSDLRAPTPTAAAELATPDKTDLILGIDDSSTRLSRAAQALLTSRRYQLQLIENRLARNSPAAFVRSGRQRIDEIARSLTKTFAHRFLVTSMALASLEQRLALLDPQAILERGYAIVTTPSGIPVKSISQVKIKSDLNVIIHDGRLNVRVTGMSDGNEDRA